MAGISVWQIITDSYELIKEHYKEVLAPLLVIILMQFGFGAMYALSGFLPKTGTSPLYNSSSMIANAMSSADTAFAALSTTAVWIIAIVALVLVFFAIIMNALNYYVAQHFYAIVAKKKITDSWSTRVISMAVKGTILGFLYLVLFGLLIGVPLALGFVSWYFYLLLIPAIIAVIVLGILLSQSWIFYLMENKGLFESFSASWKLVSDNILLYIKLWGLFILIGIGVGILSILSCCLIYVVSPILQVFLMLLFNVSAMKLKLMLTKI